MEVCPLCKQIFYGTRNYLAEDLIKTIWNLNIPLQASFSQHERKDKRAISHPKFCPGTFPCVFKSCTKEQPAAHVLTHLRYHHPTILRKVPSTHKFKEKWELEYLPDCNYPAAIYIPNMGLFYLVVNVNCDGHLDAIAQMVASDEVASTFKYKVTVSDISDRKMFTHSSKVSSCRESTEWIQEVNGLRLTLTAMEMLSMCKKYGENFHCKLSLKREDTEEEI
ncbi:uncharacterized protein LOC111865502 [Cryptotermes secundus]|uniref:uncharacterized protein LOC111865502 n=1 Tax=Cryptotermes secundus TaxID=105785 RepID=UPI000CD7CCFE|nr:uncharacterized protein LOC111865502 [Cryptotermes secundus]